MLIIPGLLTMFAVVILLLKLKGDTIRKLLGFDIYLDIGVTFLLMVIFAGTFTGMMAAIVGGLTFSIILLIMKWTMGYKKLKVVKDSSFIIPGLKWEYHEPSWRKLT